MGRCQDGLRRSRDGLFDNGHNFGIVDGWSCPGGGSKDRKKQPLGPLSRESQTRLNLGKGRYKLERFTPRLAELVQRFGCTRLHSASDFTVICNNGRSKRGLYVVPRYLHCLLVKKPELLECIPHRCHGAAGNVNISITLC